MLRLLLLVLFGLAVSHAQEMARCPEHLVIAPGEFRHCAGNPRLAFRTPYYDVKLAEEGGFYLIGRTPGVAQLELWDGTSMRVSVDACLNGLRGIRQEAKELGFGQLLSIRCEDRSVIVRTHGDLPPQAVPWLQRLDRREGVEWVPDVGPMMVRLRVELARASRSEVDRHGFDLQDPVEFVRRMADIARNGPSWSDGELLYGYGKTLTADSWYYTREVPVELGSDVRLSSGTETSVQGREGQASAAVPSGLELVLEDVKILGSGRELKAKMTVAYSDSVETERSGSHYQTQVAPERLVSHVRLRLGEPRQVMRWSPQRGQDVHHTLPVLQGIWPLDRVLGGSDRIEEQAVAVVVLTLIPDRPGTSDVRAVLQQGQAWRAEAHGDERRP